MIQVIALLARAGHGKTTVANYLRDTYGVDIVSLATPLKLIARDVMNFSDGQLWGSQAEKEAIDPRYGISPRLFMQKLGTEGIRRHLGERAFIDPLFDRIRDAAGAGRRVFAVDDVRFPNEARALWSQRGEEGIFGTVLKLVCTDAPPSGDDSHASEAGIDQVPEWHLSATVTSSRALGVEHLIGQVEAALDDPHLRDLRVALLEQQSQMRRKLRAAGAEAR